MLRDRKSDKEELEVQGTTLFPMPVGLPAIDDVVSTSRCVDEALPCSCMCNRKEVVVDLAQEEILITNHACRISILPARADWNAHVE